MKKLKDKSPEASNYPRDAGMEQVSNGSFFKSGPGILLMMMVFLLPLFSCEKDDTIDNEDPVEVEGNAVTNTEDADDYVLDRSGASQITLSGNSIISTGEGVSISGTTATITEGGTYIVSGSLTNGQLAVKSADTDKVKIILNGASITNASNSAIYLENATKTIIHLQEGTANTVVDGGASPGAIYSTSTLSIFGEGTLNITGNIDDGIMSRGGLIIKSGTYDITSAVSAIKSDRNVIIDGGTYTLTAGNDGIHADEELTINDGNINILQSVEGLEGSVVTINGGEIRLVASDDGVNASSDLNIDCYIYIHGGFLYVNAEGDGIDANGHIVMTGGTVLVNGPTGSGDGAIDYDRTFNISGGTLIAVGSANMAVAPSSTSSQRAVMVRLSAVQSAHTIVHMRDAAGTELFTYSPSKRYQSVLFSSPDLATGTPYSMYTGGSSTGSVADGLYDGGIYTSGTLQSTFSLSGTVTNIR